MNRYLSIVLLALVCATLWAQAVTDTPPIGPTGPQETDIVVPDLVLQVEELNLPQVTAVLPEEGELALGQVSIPLPGAEELYVDEGAFSVSAPGTASVSQGPSIFSSGRLGAGSANHVVGEVSLFKLGSDPRFRLRFSHEGVDGFQFRDAGTGYFSYSNVIDGWLAAGGERFSGEGSLYFNESVDGLQGNQPDYYSAGLRRTTGSASLEFKPDPLISLDGKLDTALSTRMFSASGAGSAPLDREVTLAPSAGATIAISSVDLVFQTSYFLRMLWDGSIPVHQDVDAKVGLDVELSPAFSASARAGVLWEPASGLRYPWMISADALLGDALETTLEGGYRVDRLTLGEQWSKVALTAAGDEQGTPDLVNDGQWYGTVTAKWSGVSGLALSADADFAAHDAAIDLQPYDSAANEFPFVQRSMLTLVTSARASYRPSTQVRIEGGWKGAFIDVPTGTPTSSIDGSIGVSDASERFSAVANIRSDFFPEASLPNLGFTGTFAPSDEIEFTLDFADVLAPLLPNGRPAIGAQVTPDFPFIQPGFRASLFARISL